MPAEPEKTHIARELKYGKPLIACRFDPTGKAVFAGAEDDVRSSRVGARTERRGGRCIRVHSHVAKVPAEARLEELPFGRRKRRATVGRGRRGGARARSRHHAG